MRVNNVGIVFDELESEFMAPGHIVAHTCSFSIKRTLILPCLARSSLFLSHFLARLISRSSVPLSTSLRASIIGNTGVGFGCARVT